MVSAQNPTTTSAPAPTDAQKGKGNGRRPKVGGVSRCMEVHGGVWRCMKVYGGAWRCIILYWRTTAREATLYLKNTSDMITIIASLCRALVAPPMRPPKVNQCNSAHKECRTLLTT